MSVERIFGFLEDLPKHKHLRTTDGRKISNLHELSYAVESMSPKTFKSHVSGKKNDFKDWAYSKVKDVELAQSLQGVKEQSQAAAIIHNRIVELQKSKYRYHCAFKRHALSTILEFGMGLFFGALVGLIVARVLIV